MGKKTSFAIVSLTSLVVFIVSAVFTTPALADGSTTTPTRTAPSSANLSGVPSGTKVVILDSQGNKVPLGSQAAQDILNSGDPVWCPATLAAPTPGLGGCTAAFTKFTNVN